MKRRIFTALAGLMLATISAFGQNNYGKVWVNGGGISYTSTFQSTGFASCNFLDTSNGSLLGFFGGHSNICDAAGEPLLISNGYSIYNSQGNIIDCGYKLVPNKIYDSQNGISSYTQSSLFLPLKNNKYLFITPTASNHEVETYWDNPDSGRALFDMLLYNVVDMNANSGSGKVVKRMQPLLEDVKLSKSQMMACKHGDGDSWWLLKQAHDTNIVYRFLFVQDSVSGPFTQGFAEPHFSKWDQGGQSIFSANGNKYATTCRGAGKIFVADFDRCSGLLSNPKTYTVPVKNYFATDDDTLTKDPFTEGLAFSPNGRFLYVNGYANIQQLDLWEPDSVLAWYHVANLDTDFISFQEYSSMHLGENGKIYVGNWNAGSSQMSVINAPDEKGSACSFCRRCLQFPLFNFIGGYVGGSVTSPPTMANYRLGIDTACSSITNVETPRDNQTSFSIFPNPTKGTITARYILESGDKGILQILDLKGILIKEKKLDAGATTQELDISEYAIGVYYYRLIVNGTKQATGEITLTN